MHAGNSEFRSTLDIDSDARRSTYHHVLPFARRRVPSIATARSTARADTDVGRAQAGVPDLWLLPEEALRGLGARRRLHETQTGVEPAECKNGEDCADE